MLNGSIAVDAFWQMLTWYTAEHVADTLASATFPNYLRDNALLYSVPLGRIMATSFIVLHTTIFNFWHVLVSGMARGKKIPLM